MQKQLTPLHLAAFEGHIDIVKLLVKNGANVNVETQVSIVNEYSIRVYC